MNIHPHKLNVRRFLDPKLLEWQVLYERMKLFLPLQVCVMDLPVSMFQRAFYLCLISQEKRIKRIYLTGVSWIVLRDSIKTTIILLKFHIAF